MKKGKTILFLICQPLDQRNFDRFGIQIWRENGWLVEIIDMTPLLYPKVWKSFLSSDNKVINDNSYHLIYSESQLKTLINNSKYNVFIDLVGNFKISYLKLKLKLFRRNLYCITVNIGSMPLPIVQNKSSIFNFIKLIRKFSTTITSIFEYLRYLFFSIKFQKYLNNSFVAVAGRITYQSSLINFKSDKNIIKTHNLDYDRYLTNKFEPLFDKKKYIVFLDEDMPYHSDFIYTKTKPPVTPESYFPTMNRGLKIISDHVNSEVIIAAHPRSNYLGNKVESYGNSKIFINKTLELVRNCQGVVCHSSASIQLAVLFNKPVIFVTTDELKSSFYNEYIEAFANSLGKIPLNLDEDLSTVNWNDKFFIDSQKYKDYISDYIKCPESPDLPVMQIICNFITKQCQ